MWNAFSNFLGQLAEQVPTIPDVTSTVHKLLTVTDPNRPSDFIPEPELHVPGGSDPKSESKKHRQSHQQEKCSVTQPPSAESYRKIKTVTRSTLPTYHPYTTAVRPPRHTNHTVKENVKNVKVSPIKSRGVNISRDMFDSAGSANGNENRMFTDGQPIDQLDATLPPTATSSLSMDKSAHVVPTSSSMAPINKTFNHHKLEERIHSFPPFTNRNQHIVDAPIPSRTSQHIPSNSFPLYPNLESMSADVIYSIAHFVYYKRVGRWKETMVPGELAHLSESKLNEIIENPEKITEKFSYFVRGELR